MGKIELDHTGSGSGITLSSDGTDLLLNGTAVGGGGGTPDLYADNYDGTTTLPSATGNNAVALGVLSTSSGAISFSFGNSATASGANSVALGRNAKATNSYSFATGNSYSSGTASIAMGITNNTASYGATGANSVAIGQSAKGSGANSFAHGQNSIASTTHSVAIGVGCTTTGQRALALGDNSLASASYSFSIGRSTTASQNYSYAFGYNTKAARKGTMVYGGGQFSAKGDAQCGTTVLRKATTDATSAVLTSDGSTASTVNQILLENNSAYSFSGTIVARESATDGTDCAAWKVEGLIRREGTASTTTLVNSATTVIDNTPSWGMALSADTTNGCLKIQVTGAASTNIRWVATIHTSEVTYA